MNRILPVEFDIYSYAFFKEIKCDGFFHVPEICQHNFF